MRDWYDARIASPTVSGWYDIMTTHGRMECLYYSALHGAWNEFENLPKIGTAIDVYAWAVRESKQDILDVLRGR